MITTPESGPSRNGKYLYAIQAAAEQRAYAVSGIDGNAVYNVRHGRVAAVVSDCARPRIRPERAHLAAHKEVLKRLMVESTVLPMAFGIIADNLPAVRRLLRLNSQAFLEQLARVAGRVEMGLRVTWDVPNIFELFVAIHPELRAARDRLAGHQGEPPHQERLELGQMFDHLLGEDRSAHAEKLEETLAPCCVEIKRSTPRNINEAVNLNCLVQRGAQKQFEDAVFQAAARFDNKFAFDLNGPWAPHNFVEMDLQLSNAR